MRSSRLTLALESGAFELPESGRIAVFGPSADADLSALPVDRLLVIQGFKPDHDAWRQRGYDVGVAPKGDFCAAIVFLPRAKDLARAFVAQAVACAGAGPVVVDGQKTDGIDSMFKACRKLAQVSPAMSKAHGKLFSMTAPKGAFADWMPTTQDLPQGFRTAPGVFSADGIDRASALLADSLPPLKGRVADLGAGWGYLAARVLASDKIKELHLVEADHAALECARHNVTDARARFHWADATSLPPQGTFDVIVTNPPFHNGRAADPALGQAFLRNAALWLSPAGTLYAVANRHLPYEQTLGELFRDVEEIGGDAGFKVLRAARPQAAARGRR